MPQPVYKLNSKSQKDIKPQCSNEYSEDPTNIAVTREPTFENRSNGFRRNVSSDKFKD